jgi:hypothetical protein
MIKKFFTYLKITKCLGIFWAVFRLKYALKGKMGFLRRAIPSSSWESYELKSVVRDGVPTNPLSFFQWRKENGGIFFFPKIDVSSLPSQWLESAIEETDALMKGERQYFYGKAFTIGYPPDWFFNPFSCQRLEIAKHWSQIDEFGNGDVKAIWDLNRFSFVFSLVRAYALAKDERYPRIFWELIDDWKAANIPQIGINWKCGQEVSLRAMAWCFGLYAFSDSCHSTPERVTQLTLMIAVHAERIEGNIDFALSQGNNHALSEAIGLLSIGILFPEFRRSNIWRNTGVDIIEKEVKRQVMADGSYSMHSFNYQRVMLHDSIWAIRLSELNGLSLSKELKEIVYKAFSFLSQFTDPESGKVPNYGSNDGSLILPLNSCVYTDFRPVLQAVSYLLTERLVYDKGPWDEDLFWLFGINTTEEEYPVCQNREIMVPPLAFRAGGYFKFKGKDSWGMVRCAKFVNRPDHADQLHFDLWWKGSNIACDAGSYLYNGSPPWENALAGSFIHNTITVNDSDQMNRAGRFLWLDWAQGSVNQHVSGGDGEEEYWEGEHDGYKSVGVTHRRAILRTKDGNWIVVDDLIGDGKHELVLHWLLADLPFSIMPQSDKLLLEHPDGTFIIKIKASQSCQIFAMERGKMVVPDGNYFPSENAALYGWRSSFYGQRDPALSLLAMSGGKLPVRFFTFFLPNGDRLIKVENRKISMQGSGDMDLSSPGETPILERWGGYPINDFSTN